VRGDANPGPCRGRPRACPASGNHKGCPYPRITGGVFMKQTSKYLDTIFRIKFVRYLVRSVLLWNTFTPNAL
jgi:hypothetical protein